MSESITVVGNVAAEPRRGTTGGGVPYVSFRIASDARRFDRATGQWVDGQPNWYTVSAYRALAENAAASIHQGDRVVVSGRLRLRDWNDGERRGTAAEIDADALGHDLRWGTTAFTRTARGASDAGTSGGAGTDADGWAVPGAEAQAPAHGDSRPDSVGDPAPAVLDDAVATPF